MADATSSGGRTYVFLVSRVRESVNALLSRDIHPFFIAYLFLRQTAARSGRLTGLRPDWAALGAILEVAGGPPGKPFLRPFWKGERNAGQEWLNSNLAGSFAPSSLRGVPMRVIDTDASSRFALPTSHWERAREHLLFDHPVPALAVTAFVFRDVGFVADNPPPPDQLIALFRREFGYTTDDEAEFHDLFDTTWRGTDGPWIELLASGDA